jgi:hypothetical protein
MTRQFVKRIFGVTWISLGAGYPFYCWVAQAGLYSWLVYLELMLEGKGPYTVHASLLMVPTVPISWMAVFALYKFFDSMVDRVLPPPPAFIGEAPKPVTDAPTPAPAVDKATGSPAVLCLLAFSVFLIVVGVIAGVRAFRKSSAPITFEALNLNDGKPPGSKFVKLTGLALPSLKSQYTFEVRYPYDLETYTPVVPLRWRQGDPVVYFLHLHHDALGTSGPVMIGQTGVLIRDALPGAAAFLAKKHGITLGNPTFVLDAHTDADLDPYFDTALYCTIIGLCLFLPIAVSWVGELFPRKKLPS